jgi:hypothetical protein
VDEEWAERRPLDGGLGIEAGEMPKSYASRPIGPAKVHDRAGTACVVQSARRAVPIRWGVRGTIGDGLKGKRSTD